MSIITFITCVKLIVNDCKKPPHLKKWKTTSNYLDSGDIALPFLGSIIWPITLTGVLLVTGLDKTALLLNKLFNLS